MVKVYKNISGVQRFIVWLNRYAENQIFARKLFFSNTDRDFFID